jgi:hypothetical protein
MSKFRLPVLLSLAMGGLLVGRAQTPLQQLPPAAQQQIGTQQLQDQAKQQAEQNAAPASQQLAARNQDQANEPASTIQAAEQSINPEKIRGYVKILADDAMEGRYPGTRGGDMAAAYIAKQFAADGLTPAGDNGTFLQHINFVGMTVKAADTTFNFVPLNGAAVPLAFADDYTVSNQTLTPVVDIDAPIVFVGYGATAPEFQWNDYAGVDVKGKVILCIVGDPPSDDPNFFGGKALTYYGRWTYKFEQAARMGAVGALIIHRTDLASYGWDVVKNSNAREKTYLRDDLNPHLQAASWIQLEVARKLFAASGLDLDKEFAAAGQRGFKAVELPVHLKAHVASEVRPFQSANVVGILRGDLPKAKKGKPTSVDQAVMYTAHYDHLGMRAGKPGEDNIYNGAVDNGVGSAILLELARTWAAAKLDLPHSVIFASVTAEEQGLLGSEYLGQHPPIPAAQIALDINYDALAPIGIPQEVTVDGAYDLLPDRRRHSQRLQTGRSPRCPPRSGRLLPLRPLQSLSRGHSCLLGRPWHPLGRPRPCLGRGPGQGLQRQPLPQRHGQLLTQHDLHGNGPHGPLRDGSGLERDPRQVDGGVEARRRVRSGSQGE